MDSAILYKIIVLHRRLAIFFEIALYVQDTVKLHFAFFLLTKSRQQIFSYLTKMNHLVHLLIFHIIFHLSINRKRSIFQSPLCFFCGVLFFLHCITSSIGFWILLSCIGREKISIPVQTMTVCILINHFLINRFLIYFLLSVSV